MATKVVLYVEDEADDLLFMQMAFRKLGIASRFRGARNGQEAVDYLSACGDDTAGGQAPAPALILLDLNLPILSGFEVLAWVREQPRFRSVPVIIFSSSDRPEDKLKAINLGANSFIRKPASGAGFGQVIRSLCEQWPGLGENP